VLAAGAATEVGAGEQDARPGGRRLVQFERRIGRAIRQIAPIEKSGRPEAGALDALEELLGDDLIGIDVGARQRGDASQLQPERLQCHGYR